LKYQVQNLYVFGSDLQATEKQVNELKKKVEDCVGQVKKFSSDTRANYNKAQQSVPSDIDKQLTKLELLSEDLMSSMEGKEKESKRARTVRTEYLSDSEALTTWIQGAELCVQDKTSQPQVIKESLQKIQADLPEMQERLERVTHNAKVICDNSLEEPEKALIKSNIDTLTEQLNMIRAWIDEKKQQIGDCLDSWGRFITMYNTVMNWVQEKHTFLKQPLHLESLADAKQRLHDYSGAVKSSKNIGKTVSEMSKELDRIAESGSIGDLSEKMEEAESAKAEVEGQLLERHALLHETSEEWDQCEKKLREVKAWIDKCKGGIESGAGKKKPLRDQLAAKEKMLSDIVIQKNKISMSVEKLQVHFKSSLSGGGGVAETGEQLKAELDALHTTVHQQTVELESTIAQAEQYQQEILQLKQDVVSSEQKLRAVSCPTYHPNDRETALSEQNACKEKIRTLQSKITARTERIKLLLQRGTPDLDPLT